MGIRLDAITDLAVGLVNSGNKLLTATTGGLTRLTSWSTLADWIIQTYASFTQSGIGTGTPLSQSVQTALRRGFVTAEFTGAGVGLTAWGTSALRLNTSGANNTAFGGSALAANTSGYANTAIGYQAMQANTTGGNPTDGGNTAVGAAAMISNTTGSNNTAVGLDALFTNEAGYSNAAFGSNALGFGKDGYENVAVGFRALFNGGAGQRNIAVGVRALNALLTGTGNVALGHFAGAYELGSNAFYVDNQDRTNTAGDKSSALLYGTFNATAANQTLRVNGKLTNAYGLKASSQELAVFSTTDGNLATAMQLIIQNSTTAAIQLQAVNQGTAVTRIDFNPSGGAITLQNTIATPAGGSTGVRLTFGSTAGFGVYIGSGAPSVSAAQGSLYLRSDGSSTSTRAYINTDGGTTWTAITTAA